LEASGQIHVPAALAPGREPIHPLDTRAFKTSEKRIYSSPTSKAGILIKLLPEIKKLLILGIISRIIFIK
jgi:hypothetical protein